MPITRMEMWPLTRLLAMRHRKNPKKHSLPDIIDSIVEHGFKATPMIDESTDTMVAGHGRCKALEQMKFDSLEPPDGVVLGDRNEWMVPVQITTFKSERSRDAYLIADNRLGEKGGVDDQMLADLLSELAESDEGLAGTGYNEDELDELLDDLGGDDDDEDGDSDGDGGRDVDVEGHTRTIGGHKVRPPAQMTNEDWKLIRGDCLEELRKLPDNSIDSLVTDPPAGISFMGRDWDGDKGGRDHWIDWLRAVMTECFRVLKPGGHGLVWALPRTSHWTAMALELAGFEIRDRVGWLYLSGFPKSLNVSKAMAAAEIETERDPSGWGTALKPAQEDWWLVRKPPDGTIAATFAKWGTGAINIDGSRIGAERRWSAAVGNADSPVPFLSGAKNDGYDGQFVEGRWPSNLIVSEGVLIEGVELPALYFYCPKPSKAETEAGLDALPLKTGGELTDRKDGSKGLENPRAGAGRGGDRRNTHPTKKPIALMRYLVRLITPSGGLVLDAFAGSGTTGMAALVEGCRFIGFEKEAEFHTIASERLRSIIEDPRLADELEAEEATEPAETPAPSDGSTFEYRGPNGELREELRANEVFAPGSMVESSTGGMVYVSDDDDSDELPDP